MFTDQIDVLSHFLFAVASKRDRVVIDTELVARAYGDREGPCVALGGSWRYLRADRLNGTCVYQRAVGPEAARPPIELALKHKLNEQA